MAFRFNALTDVGKVRSDNEDSFVVEPDLGMYIIADGMGGHLGGDVASKMAVEEILKFFRLTDEQKDITWPVSYDPNLDFGHNRLQASFILANGKIVRWASRHPSLKGMGTTTVGALTEGDNVLLAHVGDSRAYLFRNGRLKQLTEDHTWIREQVVKGVLTEDQAQAHPYRNMITRALGVSAEVDVEHNDLPADPGDIILLCSDGLTAMLSDDDIEVILQTNSDDIEAATGSLVGEANERGGEDNITVIILQRTKD